MRTIDLSIDREFILDLKAIGNWESESPVRGDDPDEYCREWLRGPQPDTFLTSLERSMRNPETLAIVALDDGTPVGWLWVVLVDVMGFSTRIAELNDIGVDIPHRRKGIGRHLLDLAMEHARRHHATLLRSEAGILNEASLAMHLTAGLRVHRLQLEVDLREGAPEVERRHAAADSLARIRLLHHP